MNLDNIVPDIKPYYSTTFGRAYLSNSLHILKKIKDNMIDLVLTSPPYALTREKEYCNVSPDEYIKWFLPFAVEIRRILKDSGSFVLDLGGSWKKGKPIKNLYQFKLLIALCDFCGFYLAQDIYWYNPAKLPTPAQWVTVKRIRLKDAVNNIWWFSKTPYPKADNKKVLKEYSASMIDLLENGYKPKTRPSGHKISDKFMKNNKGAISSNFLQFANTNSKDKYLELCKKYGFKPHPARFTKKIPEFFIKFLTDKNDIVLDPFAGSNVTGAVAEELERRWISIEINENYIKSSMFRFYNEINIQ
ncbi:MAG: DNA-methyltransferase [Promethearchaeota archaeon]